MIDEIIRHKHYNFNDAGLRPKIFAIEKEMNQIPKGAIVDPKPINEANIMARIDLIVTHHWSDGVYARELFIPRYAVVVGQIHKFTNLNMLVKGSLEVFIDGQIKTIIAPYTVVSPPGTKRIAYALEDSVWITVHRTDEIDIAKIEDHFIAKSEQEYLEFCKQEPMLPLEAAKC